MSICGAGRARGRVLGRARIWFRYERSLRPCLAPSSIRLSTGDHSVGSSDVAEDFRVEVELGGGGHGYSLRERLRALNLDDEARERLGKNVVVTRDGSRLFPDAVGGGQGREGERGSRE